MILNDKQITELCTNGNEMVQPFIPRKTSSREDMEGNVLKVISYGCSHFGYDIRLSSKEFKLFSFRKGYTVVDPKRRMDHFYNAIDSSERYTKEGLDIIQDNSILIPPHHYGLGVSLEKFNMPNDIMGICVGKSTYARCGVIVNVTPLEPGWRGNLTMEIFNANPLPVVMYLEEGICQIVFFRGEVPTQLYDGKYQDQKEEVTQGRV